MNVIGQTGLYVERLWSWPYVDGTLLRFVKACVPRKHTCLLWYYVMVKIDFVCVDDDLVQAKQPWNHGLLQSALTVQFVNSSPTFDVTVMTFVPACKVMA